MNDDKCAIVTVHGVGDAQPGDTLYPLAQHFADSAEAYQSSDIVIDTVRYTRFTSQNRAAPDLIEVNWADVLRPPRSVTGLLVHLARLMCAMLHVADKWHDDNSRFNIVTLYRWSFELVAFWQTLFVIYVLYLACALGNARISACVIGTLIVVAITIVVRRWSCPLLIGGCVWSLVFLVVGAAACNDDGAMNQIIIQSTRNYSGSHVSAPLTTLPVVLFILFWPSGDRTLTKHSRLARLGLAVVPFIALSILGAVLWAASLAVVATGPGAAGRKPYHHWEKLHLKFLDYNVLHIEWAMAAVIFAIGLLAVFAAAHYSFNRWIRKTTHKGEPGRLVRKYLVVALVFAPLLLFIPGLLALYESWQRVQNVQPGVLAATYAVSWIRVAPWLLFLTPAMVVVLDVAGDVLFFLMPRETRISSRRLTVDALRKALQDWRDSSGRRVSRGVPSFLATRDSSLSSRSLTVNRVRSVLEHLRAAGVGRIVVLAHSQGTVISSLAAVDMPDLHLITMGSPLDSLYQHLLCWTPDTNRLTKTWINLYRDGDYIGGSVAAAPTDRSIGQGGHVHYWSAKAVLDEADRIVKGG